jgi:hypothetical protein
LTLASMFPLPPSCGEGAREASVATVEDGP